MINYTNIALSFKRTHNEIKVSRNTYQNTTKLICIGKNIPDKVFDTFSVQHVEMEIENACLDTLFEAQ